MTDAERAIPNTRYPITDTPTPDIRHPTPWPWLLLAVLCFVAFFWRLGGNGLFDLDEALYVESAREMRLTGDYVTPRVNGQPFFEKPPLIYWEAAGLFALFGRSELTARLPSALASAALVALLYVTGTRWFGRRAGLVAALSFALCPLALGTARQLTTDATLDLCVAVALVAFFATQTKDRGGDKETRRQGDNETYTPPSTLNTQHSTLNAAVYWAACALGVLAKGLPGILIPVVVGLLYLGFEGRWKWRRVARGVAAMRPVWGIAVFLLIAAPWHILAWRQSGGAFYHEYIVVQHLARFRGGDTAHRAPFWFFAPGFLLGFFPMSVFVPAALLDRTGTTADTAGTEGTSATADRARLLLKIWAVVVFLMFSAAGSKLISYILPMYPAAALLVGDWLVRAAEGRRRRALVAGTVVAFALAALVLAIVLLRAPILHAIVARTHRPLPLDQVPPGAFEWAEHLFIAVAAGTGLCLALLLARRPWAAFGALAAGMAAFLAVAVGEGLPLLNRALLAPLQNEAALAGHVGYTRQRPVALYLGRTRRPSALFYLPDELIRQGRVTEVMGSDADHADIARFLAANPGAVVVTNRARADWLLARPGARLLSADDGWATVATGPLPGPDDVK